MVLSGLWRRAINFRADSTFRAGDWSAVVAKLLPRVETAVKQATDAVYEESQVLVPVDTGELHDTAYTRIEIKSEAVTGNVIYPADHAPFVEFGTGRRGAASAGAGPWTYNQDWPGMIAQPYLRPALDAARPQIRAAFADAGFVV